MMVRVAIDAMGGDKAPRIVFDGIEEILKDNSKTIEFHLFGPAKELEDLSHNYPLVKKNACFIDAPDVIHNHMKVLEALKFSKKSSMRLSIEHVASGNADFVVSAGNTGAYMALSKNILGVLEGVDRPSLPAIIPNPKGPTVLLDAGANLECSSNNLIQFALMGEAFFRSVYDIPSPRIGLLNVGTEESKGHQELQIAFKELSAFNHINFIGFVEGNDITNGSVDVVVTDGFSGNIALKAIEGTASFIRHVLGESLRSTLLGKIGSWIAQAGFQKFKSSVDPRLHNGTLLLGLKKHAIKSHGGTDGVGFAHAIKVGCRLMNQNFHQGVQASLAPISKTSIQLEPSNI